MTSTFRILPDHGIDDELKHARRHKHGAGPWIGRAYFQRMQARVLLMGQPFPSVREMAADLGWSTATVNRWLADITPWTDPAFGADWIEAVKAQGWRVPRWDDYSTTTPRPQRDNAATTDKEGSPEVTDDHDNAATTGRPHHVQVVTLTRGNMGDLIPEKETPAPALTKAQRLDRDVAEAWAHHSGLNVAGGFRKKPTALPKQHAIRGCVRDIGLDDTKLLSDWLHHAGKHPDEDGTADGWAEWARTTTIPKKETLFRPGQRAERLALAKAWDAAGRPGPGAWAPTHPADPFDAILAEASRHNRRADPPEGMGGEWLLHPDPNLHRRARDALERISGSRFRAAWEWWCNLNDRERTWKAKDWREAMRAVAA